MAGETIIAVVGNLTADPELRFTQSGAAVASFTVASTPRTFNRQTGEWEDGEAMFLRTSVWRDQAENIAESLQKGDRVIVQGRLKQRSFTDRDGNNRTVIELDADEVGPSLRYATARPQRVQRNAQGAGGYGGGQQGGDAPQGQGYAPQGQQGGYGGQGSQGVPQGGYAPQQGGQAPQGGQQRPQGQGAPQNAPQGDPWGSHGGGGYDDPPF